MTCSHLHQKRIKHKIARIVCHYPRQKKNIASATTGTSSKTGSPYNVNNPFGGQTQEQFIGEENSSRIRKESAEPLSLSANKSMKSIDQRNQIEKDLSLKRAQKVGSKGTDIINNLAAGLNDMYSGLAKIPRYVYDLAAVPQNLLSEQFNIPSLKADYDQFLVNTNMGVGTSPLTLIDQIGDYYQAKGDTFRERQTKYDQGIWDSLKGGDFENAGNQIINNIAGSLPSMTVIAATGSAGNVAGLNNVGTSIISALPFASSKSNEIRDNDEIPDYLKPIYSGINGLSEVVFDRAFGTQAIINKIGNTLAQEGEEAALKAGKDLATGYITSAFNKIKEPLTDLGKNALEEVATQFSQNLLDKITINPDKDLTEGLIDAGIVGGVMGGTLGSVNNVLKTSTRQSIAEKNQRIETLSNDLDNPNVPESVKQKIGENIQQIKQEINDEISKSKQEFDTLDETGKERALEVSGQIQSIDKTLADPIISEDTKTVLEQSKKELEKQLDSIKPAEQVTFNYETVDEVPESLRDRVVESDGKISITMPKSEADALQKRIDERLEPSTVRMEGEESKAINPRDFTDKPASLEDFRKNAQEFDLYDNEKELLDAFEKYSKKVSTHEQVTQDLAKDNPANYLTVEEAIKQYPQVGQVPKDILDVVNKLGSKVYIYNGSQQELNTLNKYDDFWTKDIKENPSVAYYPASGSDIFINANMFGKQDGSVNLLAHELSHVFTGNLINTPDNLLKDYQKEFKNDINKYYKFYKKTFGDGKVRSITYGFTNPAEFVAEYMTNEKFRKSINDRDNSFLTKIRKFFSRLMGKDYSIQELENVFNTFNKNIRDDLGLVDDIAETQNVQQQTIETTEPSNIQDIELDIINNNPDLTSEEKERAINSRKQQGGTDAIQKRSTEKMDVPEQAKDGERMEQGNTERSKVTKEVTPKQVQGDTETEIDSFNSLFNEKLPTRETRETQSNVERETGGRLAQEIKEFKGVDFKASMEYGDRLVQSAKNEFGNDYVTKLTDKVKKSDMSIDKKAVILQSIENDLRKQLLADPTNTKLKKQVNLATKETISYLQETARATAVGIFRQAARANYNIQEAADAIFSTKENQDRNKIEEAVFSTSEDIQKEYETQQKDGGIDADLETAIQEGVEKRLNELYESLPSRRRQQADKAIKALDNIQKRLRSKTYESSIGLPVAIIDAGISTIKAAIKAGVAVADAVELGISKIKEQYGKKWDKEDDFRKDMLDGFKQEGVDTIRQRAQQDNLKQALIAAGYGKEITVRTKNGRETRDILDWKKLTGEEGSFETLKENLAKLKDKGFSDAEIAELQTQLEEEYNDIHASIIEKSLNELNRRNAPKEGKQKILARRLAELYNLGVYDQDVDTYQNILNNALGFSTESQEAFNEIRKLNESLARLLDSRDDKGNKFSDVALASLESQIKNRISKVIQKAQFAEGNGVFKASVVLKNVFSAMQRMMLATIGQIIENPFSGHLNDLQVALQDAFKKGKWDTKELAQHRRQLARIMYKDAALNSGEEYGGVGNPFTSKNAIEDFVNGISDTDVFKKITGAKNLSKFKAMYQAMIGLLSGRQYLDAADSYFKIKRTEKEFTHNLLRILTDKTNPNGAMKQEDALQYVSEIITGQTFTEAKDTARRIINNINEQAGKELLRPSETNVIRVANDLVKDNLVNGQKVTAQQVESAFKAAYKTAGKSIGHESNNIITDALSSFSQTTEQKLKDALKKKDWSTAALLNMTNTLVKNVAFPFVGGGTNWTVIGLQKMGVPTEWFRSDVGFSKKPIDLSTKEGSKELEKALAANATRQRMYARNLIGSITALSAILAMRALGDEDEYEKWLKKHKETAKLINKLQPVPLTLYMSLDEGDDKMTDAMLEVIGRRKNYDNFKLKRATENFYDGYRNGKKQKVSKAWGELGEIVGRRFNIPYLQSVRNIWTTSAKIEKEFTGTYKKEEKPSKSNGFVDGYFKGGMAEFLGITNDDKK